MLSSSQQPKQQAVVPPQTITPAYMEIFRGARPASLTNTSIEFIPDQHSSVHKAIRHITTLIAKQTSFDPAICVDLTTIINTNQASQLELIEALHNILWHENVSPSRILLLSWVTNISAITPETYFTHLETFTARWYEILTLAKAQASYFRGGYSLSTPAIDSITSIAGIEAQVAAYPRGETARIWPTQQENMRLTQQVRSTIKQKALTQLSSSQAPSTSSPTAGIDSSKSTTQPSAYPASTPTQDELIEANVSAGRQMRMQLRLEAMQKQQASGEKTNTPTPAPSAPPASPPKPRAFYAAPPPPYVPLYPISSTSSAPITPLPVAGSSTFFPQPLALPLPTAHPHTPHTPFSLVPTAALTAPAKDDQTKRAPMHLILIADVSNPMRDTIPDLKQVLKGILDYVRRGDCVSIIKFDNTATIIVNATEIVHELPQSICFDIRALRQIVDKEITEGHGTNIIAGFEAINLLKSVKLETHIILATDSVAIENDTTIEADNARILQLVTSSFGPTTPIHSIGLTDNVDTRLIGKLSHSMQGIRLCIRERADIATVVETLKDYLRLTTPTRTPPLFDPYKIPHSAAATLPPAPSPSLFPSISPAPAPAASEGQAQEPSSKALYSLLPSF